MARGERLEHQPLDVHAGQRVDVVLALVEDLERVEAVVDAALEPPGHAARTWASRHSNVLRWYSRSRRSASSSRPGTQSSMSRPIELPRGGALHERLDHLAGDEADHPERVELAELVAVVGEQRLGHELEQDRVVALERREHVGVGLQRREAVDPQVAGAAARLAAGLDRLGRVPGGHRLEPGRGGLELAPLALRVVGRGERAVEVGDQLLLREVQRVGAREQRHQPALVHPVVEQDRLLVAARRPELPAAVARSARRS